MSRKVDHPVTEEQVRTALKRVKFPGLSRDIVSFGFVKSISVGVRNDITVTLQVTTRDPAVPAQIQRDVKAVLVALDGVGSVNVNLMATQQSSQPSPAAAAGGLPQPVRIAGVKYIIAIGSGKGGVGKSTIAVNLACALSRLGHAVGLMDADVYGPSVPKMLGAVERPNMANNKLEPVEKFGLKLMSMALLMDADAAVIWRGPMIAKVIQEFSHAVNWGKLDVLLVDLPPGTGDAQISLAQTLVIDGGIIVTTPQDVALEVARRGITMFEKVNVKILGIIENMSYYVCPHCGQRDDVFGHGGAKREAERLEVPFLGELPLNTEIRAAGDRGEPIVVAAPDSEAARAFRKCAEAVWTQLEKH